MLVEAQFSVQLGLLGPADFMRLQAVLKSYELSLRTKFFNSKGKFLEQLKSDKKSKKAVPCFILIKSIGGAHCQKNQFFFPVEDGLLEKILDWAQEEFTLPHLRRRGLADKKVE